jgi:hypothetical protein
MSAIASPSITAKRRAEAAGGGDAFFVDVIRPAPANDGAPADEWAAVRAASDARMRAR